MNLAGQFRWVLVAVLALLLFGLNESAGRQSAQETVLGIRSQQTGQEQVIVWVLPAGPAWDAGIRPGDTVIEVDGRPVLSAITPDVVAAASTITVRQPDGHFVEGSTGSARVIVAGPRRLSFQLIATSFMVVGGVVYILAADVLAASLLLTVSTTAAAMLLAALATHTGAAWAVAVEYAAVVVFGTSLQLFFVVFPVNHFSSRWGRSTGSASIICAAVLLALFVWVIVADTSAYDLVQRLIFGTTCLYLLGSVGLVIDAFVRRRHEYRVRGALGFLVLGTVVALIPFPVLSLLPFIAGQDSIVPADATILAIVFLPASLGAALLSRQFLGVQRFIRRGLVSLTVWMGLLICYTIVLSAISLTIDGAGRTSTSPGTLVIDIAIVGATFTPAQRWLRFQVERVLFRDVYIYPATLEELSVGIVQLPPDEAAISQHILARLGALLDLTWMSLVIAASDSVRTHRWGTLPPMSDPLQWLASSRQQRMVASDHGPVTTTPLIRDGQLTGVLVAGPKNQDIELTSGDQSLLATLAPLIATALANARLVADLQAQVEVLATREQDLRELSAQLMRVQEEERQRLALDVHDDPLQRAILLVRAFGEAPAFPEAQRYRQDAEEIVAALRAICSGVRPGILEDFGLVAGIESLVNEIRARSDLSATLQVQGEDSERTGRLAPELEIALYRVTQEALNNCLKHSGADTVAVRLWLDGSTLCLSVADNGRNAGAPGAQFSTEGRTERLGLLGMNERLRPMHGTVEIDRRPGNGTVVTATVPVHYANSIPAKPPVT